MHRKRQINTSLGGLGVDVLILGGWNTGIEKCLRYISMDPAFHTEATTAIID